MSDRKKNKAWLASAIFLGVVLIGGMVSLIPYVMDHFSDNNHQSPTHAAVANHVHSKGSSKPSTSSDGCNVPEGSQEVPKGPFITTPIIVTDGTAYVRIPTLKGYGPETHDGIIAKCYGHNPTGAILRAASVFSYNLTVGVKPDEVMKDIYLPGEIANSLLASTPSRRITTDDTKNQTFKIIGFKADVKSKDEVLVTLAFRSSEGGMGQVPLLMKWYQDDWRWDPPNNGTLGAEPLKGLYTQGFTEWRNE